MTETTTKGSWTFTYWSDGHHHDVTITADTFTDAVAVFSLNFGDTTTYSVRPEL